MNTPTTKPAKFVLPQASKGLIDAPVFNTCSIWVLLHNGQNAGKILWTIGSGGTWKCAVIVYHAHVAAFGIPEQDDNGNTPLSSLVIGSAGGGGYDKRTAAFEDCMRRNGINSAHIGGAGRSGISDYFQGLGFTVIEAI